MFGKGAIIAIFGFVLMFSYYQLNLARSITDTVDNYNQQYMETQLREAVTSAMNMGVSDVWENETGSDDWTVVINQCSTRLTITTVNLDTILVKSKSWTHMYDPEAGGVTIVADSIMAYFSYRTSVAEYFAFTNDDRGLYWITGDTLYGRVHTNTTMNTWGTPVFYGKVTAKNGINPNPVDVKNKALYYGGWEIGVDASVPSDLTYFETAVTVDNGGAAVNTKSIYDQETYLEFLADGTVKRTVGSDPPDTVSLAAIAPGGTLWMKKDVHVKGIISGQLTIYSSDDIWIDDDIVYADNPESNPTSTDMLGLVAKGSVYITDNVPNSSDIYIQASIMTINGTFMAQNYDKRGICGDLHLLGSTAQDLAGIMGVFSFKGGLISGFITKGAYDERFESVSPPRYPYVRALKLVSWWE